MTQGERNESYPLENKYLICQSCTFSKFRGERGSDLKKHERRRTAPVQKYREEFDTL